MATTSDYLTQLQTDKQTLVDNLVAKGVEATADETFTSLCPKVADIQSGGIDDYIDGAPQIDSFLNSAFTVGGWLIRELPDLDFSKAASNITSFSNYFAYMKQCAKIGKITSNSYVTNVSGMFRNNSVIENLDLTGMDFTNITSMSYFCNDCSKLKNIIMPTTKNNVLKYLDYAYYGCSELEIIDLSNIDTSNTTRFNDFIRNCTSLVEIKGVVDLTSNTQALNNAFWNCPQLVKIYIKGLNKTTSLSMSTLLSNESVDYILNNVQDVTEAPQTLTLGANLEKASEEAIAHATSLGWTIN